jgi:Uma2 family endonuclease
VPNRRRCYRAIAYNKDLKARLYARHRVREFWVIDANDRSTWVHTGPSGDEWSSITQRGPHDSLIAPVFPGFSLHLSEID